MRQSNYTTGWLPLLILFLLLSFKGYGQIRGLIQLLSMEQRDGYSIPMAHPALLGFYPHSEFAMMGLQQYGLFSLNSIGVMTTWSKTPKSFQFIEMEYFGFEQWKRWQLNLRSSRQITPNFYAALAIVYKGQTVEESPVSHTANADLFFCLRAGERLYFTSEIRHLLPWYTLSSKEKKGWIAIRSYYWISPNIGIVGGISLARGIGVMAGLGWQNNKTALALRLYPVSGRFVLGVNQVIITNISLITEFEFHPVLGISTVGGICWSF